MEELIVAALCSLIFTLFFAALVLARGRVKMIEPIVYMPDESGTLRKVSSEVSKGDFEALKEKIKSELKLAPNPNPLRDVILPSIAMFLVLLVIFWAVFSYLW